MDQSTDSATVQRHRTKIPLNRARRIPFRRDKSCVSEEKGFICTLVHWKDQQANTDPKVSLLPLGPVAAFQTSKTRDCPMPGIAGPSQFVRRCCPRPLRPNVVTWVMTRFSSFAKSEVLCFCCVVARRSPRVATATAQRRGCHGDYSGTEREILVHQRMQEICVFRK
jgi:hypothetical protein